MFVRRYLSLTGKNTSLLLGSGRFYADELSKWGVSHGIRNCSAAAATDKAKFSLTGHCEGIPRKSKASLTSEVADLGAGRNSGLKIGRTLEARPS